jgi:hypothetical protein
MAHCKNKLSYPAHGCLTNIDFEAGVKPCHLKTGITAKHTTTITNQRTGGIYQIEICVRSKSYGVVLDGDSSLTEYKFGIPSLRSGNDWSHSLNIERNHNLVIPNDEIDTSVTFYDSTQQVKGKFYGSSEGAAITFSVDLSE